MDTFTTCVVTFNYNSHNCFISLPSSLVSQQENQVYQIISIKSNVKAYCGWNGKLTSRQNTIDISSEFASSLGFTENEQVIVSKVQRVQHCQKVSVVPVSQDDWVLVAQNSEFIQATLMNQIRPVWHGMIFPIWLQSNMVARVKISTLSPKCECAILSEDTELHVLTEDSSGGGSDRGESPVGSSNPSSSSPKSMLTSLIGSIFKSISSQDLNPESSSPVIHDPNFVKLPSFPTSVMLKLIPIKGDLTIRASKLFNVVFVSKNQFPELSNSLAILSVVLPPFDPPAGNSEQETSKKRPTVTTVLVMADDSILPGQTYICPSLQKQFGISQFFRIVLSPIEESSEKSLQSSHSLTSLHKIQVASCLELTPLKPCKLSPFDLLNKLDQITPEHGILVVDGTLLIIGEVEFVVKSDRCLLVKSKSVQQVNFNEYVSSSASVMPKPIVCSLEKPWNKKEKFYGFSQLAQEVSSSIASALKVEIPYSMPHSSGNKSSFIALIGPRGSGKTHLIKHCIDKYMDEPFFVSVKWIDCKVLRGRRLDALNKLLMKELGEVTWIQPAIIVLEELNHLTSSCEKPSEASNVELFYLNRVSRLMIQVKNVLENTLHSYGKQLLVIGTAYNEESLHEVLIKSGYFNSIYHLKPPEASDRKDLIRGFISSFKPSVTLDPHFDLDLLVQKTEGFLPVDLKIMVNQAIHYYLTSHGTRDEITVTGESGNVLNAAAVPANSSCVSNQLLKMDHVLAVLAKYKPLNLRNIKFSPQSHLSLINIGGLEEVKKTLIETIEWSSRYPNLMSKCPLRPASAILLYGPPGTGKTILAQTIANHTGLNFLSISGPELLSKYIGASELAIRELFNSARAAKPCIVFFDEFDSIAPRRGHDSTGVTDRVVNQLLTQMDGVEGMDRSIFILAATSRPDLLDPALLRPGRFDLTLHCNLPTSDERLSILKSLVENVNLAPDVDLEQVANSTEGFTGADLHAILYTAQMTSARYLMSKKEPFERTSKTSLHSSPPASVVDSSESSHSMASHSSIYSHEVTGNNVLVLDTSLKCGSITPATDDIICTLSRFNLLEGTDETSEKSAFNVANNSTSYNGASERLKSMLIQHKDIEDALKSTKPSIGPLEREKYSKM